jgi:hypothetical protein
MTVLYDGVQVECSNLDYSSPTIPLAEIVLAKSSHNVPIDEISPINTAVFKKYTEGSDFSYMIIENIVGQVYKWTMPLVGQSWKSGLFGEGVPPVSHGVKIHFSELPKYIREKYLQAKMFQQ